jgi:hypothetical protein
MGKSPRKISKSKRAYGPVVCFTRVLMPGLSKTTNMETILDETWKQRDQNWMFLSSIIFPREPTNGENILSGDGFVISGTRVQATNFKQVNPFTWFAENDRNETIVVHWGEIANQITETIQSLNILANSLVNIIVLYASPLSVFVPENVPTLANWNDQNNTWFLGEWSNAERCTQNEFYLESDASKSKNCISKKLFFVKNDLTRLQKLFDFLESTGKTMILFNDVLTNGYYDKVNGKHIWIPQIGSLQTRAERFHLFGLVINQRSRYTKHWFHENCPLDNF